MKNYFRFINQFNIILIRQLISFADEEPKWILGDINRDGGS